MPDAKRARVELTIRGRVQGVFYRASARRKARELGLSGYVANLDDGSVLIVAEGDAWKLEALAEWCHVGPPEARVVTVDVVRGEATGEFQAFGIR